MKIIKAIATWSECYKANGKITPTGIVVHSTGANNPNLKRYVNSSVELGENIYKNYWGTGSKNDQEQYGIPHAAIGKDRNGSVAAVQVLPWTMRCWGCGSGKNGSYNASHIQFEICEDGLTNKTYFDAAFDLAAQFCAYLMEMFPSIKVENIVSHKEACARGYASNHGDPENWLSKFGKNMDWFRDKVKSYCGVTAAVTYSKLSDLVGTKNASITTVFKQKGDCWDSGWHNGVDIACAAGTPIYAAADGTVINADTTAHSDGFGNRVVIKHPDGRATVYAHMIAPASVKVGQAVNRGQLIGKVGSTGLSYGNHLHFTLIDNWDKKPNIYYSGDLLDPVKVLGLGSLKYANSSGTSETSTPARKLKVGDIVDFVGTTHYDGSMSSRGTAAKPGKAKITIIASKAAHPYHLIHEDDKSTVFGWVNASDIVSGENKTVDEIALEVIRGEWGNGEERRKKLTDAGYDADKVQKKVNRLL